jgi:UDP-3-O-[3-hydroxymyristoyl] glucosamine N-acyltransferase
MSLTQRTSREFSRTPGRLELARFLENLRRDGAFRQTQFASADVPESLCFIGRAKYLRQANDNAAISCVITSPEFAPAVAPEKGLAVAADPERVFYELHNKLFYSGLMHPDLETGVDASADIHSSAVVAEHCYIGKGVTIGPGAVVEAYSHLGDGVEVGPGAIVGASGHFFKRYGGKLFKVAHAGGVWLEEDAHILAGAIVSKAVHTDFTRVGRESVISVGTHVGHGCKVGERCTLAGGVQVSGYTAIGNDVWIGPSAVIGNLLHVGDGVRVETGSVVVKNVAAGEVVSGNFAYSHRRHLREHARRVAS